MAAILATPMAGAVSGHRFCAHPSARIDGQEVFTGEYRHVSSPTTLHTARLGWSRTRIGQDVEANLDTPLPVFVPGRDFIGGIDIGGIPGRFGTQTTANLRLTQDIFGAEYGLVHTRGRHLLKAGAMAERYVDDMVNPTFSLGIHTFANLEGFLRNRSQRFVGLTPEADLRPPVALHAPRRLRAGRDPHRPQT